MNAWTDIPGWFNEQEGVALADLARAVAPNDAIIEIGTWCARSACCMGEAVRDRNVAIYTIDSYPPESQAEIESGSRPSAREAAAIAGVAVRDLGLGQVVHLVHGDSLAGLLDIVRALGATPRVGLLHVDGHHAYAQVEAELTAYAPHLTPISAVAFHDYGHGPYRIMEVAQAVLPRLGFVFSGQTGGLGVWKRAP